MEFGASYPFEEREPLAFSVRDLSKYHGQFGQSLGGLSRAEQTKLLPPYVRKTSGPLPEWKKRFIRQNRNFFEEYRELLEPWLPKLLDHPASFQKLEWNWKQGDRTIWNKIVQFRASGIRVKRPNVAPSLVALTTSQIPVVTWEKRYMTMRECARLQSLGELNHLPASKTKAHHALGNAVNSKVIEAVAEALLSIKERKVLPWQSCDEPNMPRTTTTSADAPSAICA